MENQNYMLTTANAAVAKMAYMLNEVCPIYPITPASGMSELVEEWSANQVPNIFGSVPNVYEMQSEAGVAGALHGALQVGSLASTFTSSQGLLLMAPNMYKMAGELTPHVIHVATRSIATHALSIFSDHSDIMAVRGTGYGFLGSSSVQEASDFALIAQITSLKSRIPFVHFFDGFRTSHETAKIESISEETIKSMLNDTSIFEHRQRALNPERPVLRGTSQAADVFFQSREASNGIYDSCPSIVQNVMNDFFELTGRKYELFEYVGDPNATHVIISMASSTEVIENTLEHLNNNGSKTGLIKVKLFRPFSHEHLVKALPRTCQAIVVLDRTKEPGSSGEPLYLDITQSILRANSEKKIENLPLIIGGRYGLSSKELTPNMVNAIMKNLISNTPVNGFTIGIKDDLTFKSLDFSEEIELNNDTYEAIFYETKSKMAANSFNSAMQLISKNSNKHIQGFTEVDYDKSKPKNISHFRYSDRDIKAPYLISKADFIGCDSESFLSDNTLLERLKENGTLLVNSSRTPEEVWNDFTFEQQLLLQESRISFYVVNLSNLQSEYVVKEQIISGLQACFFVLNEGLVHTYMLYKIYLYLEKVDTTKVTTSRITANIMAAEASTGLIEKLVEGTGNDLPVSMFPVDGTYPTNTASLHKGYDSEFIPEWNAEECIQCGACSMACPQGAIRIKAFEEEFLCDAPEGYKSAKSIESDWQNDLLSMTVQTNVDQCNACNHCVEACPSNALEMVERSEIIDSEKQNWDYFEELPEFDRAKINPRKISQQQLQEPLFKYPMGVNGCGQAAYLKLISQLFGDRMILANATGSSSIVGGALPTTPWSKNDDGRGPAWSNSLFEDNAEFGLGFRLSLDQQKEQAIAMLKKMTGKIDFELIHEIVNTEQNTESEIIEQRSRVQTLRSKLALINTFEAKNLYSIADSLVKKSVWIVGGDGWAYDIGYGGLDHVMASGKNVNILVLDNEIYDNTGAQMSKATPFGATAKFAAKGKTKEKKDLGLMAMNYDGVYVASVSIGADQEQTLQAFVEAESYDGPSIIIAYCHSESHGIDIKKPGEHHTAAVQSGQWLLYRNDPRRNDISKNPFQLDSPVPTLRIGEYFKMEKRFENLFKGDPQDESKVIREIQKKIDRRYNTFLAKTLPSIHSRSKLIQTSRMLKTLRHG